jgi:hypothetical protein
LGAAEFAHKGQATTATQNAALATSTEGPGFPDRTEAPGSRIPEYAFPFTADSTKFPGVGEKEEITGELAKSPSELADKYFFSQIRKESVVFLIPLIPMLWMFVQDNGAGRLQTGGGVLWLLSKCGIVLLLCGIPLAMAVVTGWVRR